MGFRLPKTKEMLRREAAGWLARLQSGRDPDVERKFRRWHDAHPSHAEAFDRVRRSFGQAALLRHSPTLARSRGEPARRSPVRKPRYAFAAAAALAFLVPAGLLLMLRSPLTLGSSEVLMLATAVGEVRSVNLSDGSRVTLDTATTVEVEIGRFAREARLKKGRARFQVAQTSEPFVVDAGTATVTTRSAVVDVERFGPQSRVNVIAGTAEVQPGRHGDEPLTVAAGQALTADTAGLGQKKNEAAAADWTHGMLQFQATPIAAAIALANRYSNRRILVDPNLGQLRISGAFRAGDTEGLASALAAAFDLTVREDAAGNFILSRRNLSRSTKKNGG